MQKLPSWKQYCNDIEKHGLKPDRNNIVGAYIFLNDIKIKRVGPSPKITDSMGKEPIREFSYKSRKNLMFVASNTEVIFKVVLTLTFPTWFPTNGKIIKKMLRKFLNHLLKHFDGLEYLWFCEFQERGAPHFHVLLSCKEYSVEFAHWVAFEWFMIVGSRDWEHLKTGTRTEKIREQEGGKRYAVKYGAKMKQKEVPEGFENVGRFWGHSKGVKPILKDVKAGDTDVLLEMFTQNKWVKRAIEKEYEIVYNVSSSIQEIPIVDIGDHHE